MTTTLIHDAMPKLAKLAEQGATLDMREAADLAEVASRTIRAWVFVGKGGRYLRAYRLGSHGKLRTTARELLEFLEHVAVEDRNGRSTR